MSAEKVSLEGEPEKHAVVAEAIISNALIDRFKLVGERVEVSGLNPLLI